MGLLLSRAVLLYASLSCSDFTALLSEKQPYAFMLWKQVCGITFHESRFSSPRETGLLLGSLKA